MISDWQYTVAVALLLLAAVVLGALILVLWSIRRVVGVKVLIALELAVLEWTLGNTLEYLSPDLAGKSFWVNVEYLGIVAVPVLWLMFALQFAGREKWLTWRRMLLLWVVPAITALLSWTNDLHGLMRFNVRLDTSGPFPIIAKTYGPWFWVHTTYSYLLLLIASYLLLRALNRSPLAYRQQRNILLTGILLPWLANVLYVFHLIPDRLDLTPLLFTVAGVIITLGLFRFRLFELVPIARETVIDSMTDGVLVIDPHDRIADVNPCARSLLGLLDHDLVGKPAARVWPAWSALAAQLDTTHEVRTEIDLGDQTARRFIDLSLLPLYDGKGQFIGRLVILRDIGDYKRVEDSLRHAQSELEARVAARTAELAAANEELRTEIAERQRAEAERETLIQELKAKNSELERFAYTVSHDLKAPLVTIRGFLELLEEDMAAGQPESIRDEMQHIQTAADRMRRLLDELLELSRVGRLVNPPQEIPFEAIAREAVDLLAGAIKTRGVQVQIARDLPVVYGDRVRLVEVVQNLVDNAVKFMGDQSEPRIDIGVRAPETDGGLPIFFVRDNGMGLVPATHERIFDLFHKLDVHSPGTGVGLALVKRIVEVHGGRIWAESDGLNAGSTFCFTLNATTAQLLHG